MPEQALKQNSLVLYKNRPGLIKQTGKKIEIELEGNQTLSVRPKDVTLLHPGPISSLATLGQPAGEVETAWELLAGEITNLAELAELIYEIFTPATAWAAWQLVDDGLYFSGQPDEITAHLPQQVQEIAASRAAKEAEKQAWDTFVTRVNQGQYLPEDSRYLEEVAALARSEQEQSRVLRVLGHEVTPQNAHALLWSLAYWDHTVNPYPQREGVPVSQPDLPIPQLPEEPRRDLTHLLALAIDDEGNQDPDDAISLDEGRLWVHIADVAALVPPDSPADLEARGRGANLYLPEGTVTMLPPRATQLLGLGLSPVSPALSFALDLKPDGEVAIQEIVPSWVRVTRLTYEEAETRLQEPPFQQLYDLARAYETRRHQNEAIQIDLPEVKVWVDEAAMVQIRPLPPLHSRDLVREAMLMTGEAVARFALEHEIPLPFSVQEAPEEDLQALPGNLEGLARMFAVRRLLKRSQRQKTPAPHAGLGMDMYVQTTSPLRRYLDLVSHQQLRAFVTGQAGLDAREVMERVGAAEAVAGSVKRAERLSLAHWTLVYLMQHPDWQGEGVIVEKRGKRALILIPALALETKLYLRQDLPLNSVVQLALERVSLAELEAHFLQVK
jgi:exoribonuclease-2